MELGKEPCVGQWDDISVIPICSGKRVRSRPQPADLLLCFSAFPLIRLSFTFGVLCL